MRFPARRPSAWKPWRWEFISQLVLILVIFLAALAFFLYSNKPSPYQAAPVKETQSSRLLASPSPTDVQVLAPSTTEILFTPTPTPLPLEFIENREQTIGIIIATFVLVIIVIGGTLRGILTRRRE